jgi:tryptophanyl-tRNA synthetase
LHLGHYFGALSNWVRMQEEYDCFYFVADWHALTTHYAEDTRLVPQNTLAIALDWLSTGIDPEKSTLFVQSQVPEHAELHLLLSMVTPLDWLERVPTYKELISQLKEKDLGTYGFLGYPLLQAADIVMYGAGSTGLFVPVGEDQVPHVELAREIVRRFNFLFGLDVKRELFADTPEASAAREKLSAVLPSKPATWALDDGAELTVRASVREMGIDNFLKQAGNARRWFRYRPAPTAGGWRRVSGTRSGCATSRKRYGKKCWG